MFDAICALIPRDPDYPPRVATLDVLRRVLAGTIYNVLPYQFHEERGAGGEYIPIRQRRPSIRYALCRTVVEDSVALLFSEGHFPAIVCADLALRGFLADLVRDAGLNAVMIDAALRGSVGSVALLLRILKGRVYVSVLDSLFLTPVWRADAPDTLASVTEQYKVRGALLAAQGYEIAEPATDYWFMRRWDAEAETWFLPWPVGATPVGGPEIDAARTVRHGLGFVPLVWVRNLPGGDGIDGSCTFRAAVETGIEIDYQLSQAGRGLTYSSDPTLLIKEPATTDREIIKGAGNALVVSKDGDARLLEIGGTAANAVIDYVRVLRELALESVHGNRSSADRIAAAQSGRALELMNQGLILIVLQTTRLATSSGPDVDSFGADFGMTRLAAVSAQGSVTFSRYTPTMAGLIPAGTTVTTSDSTTQFTVGTDMTNAAWNASQGGYLLGIGVASITVPITASVAGSAGNVLAGTISLITSALPGVDSVTNALALTGGLNAETDAAFRLRFQSFINSRTRATVQAVTYAATSIQQGVNCTVQENTDGGGDYVPGRFVVTVDDGSGSPPATLLTAIQSAVDAVRPVGSIFAVNAPTILPANIALTLAIAPGSSSTTAIAAVNAAITGFVNSLPVGTDLPYTRLAQLAYDASPGVTNVSGLTLQGGAADLTATPATVIKIGSLAIG
jgi:uncharacterized phage protein gp47/JayE